MTCIDITTAVLLKKTAAIVTTVVMHDGDLEHCLIKERIDVYIFFFSFICSDSPGLTLGVLKMLIHVCFRDALQPADC